MAIFDGTAGSDVLPGLLGILTGLGNDEINGLGGDDTLIGYAGDDIIEGGAGADNIIGGILNVGLGLGTLELSGNDTATYQSSNSGVTINLSAISAIDINILGINIELDGTSIGSGGDAEGDQLTGITNLTGSAHADTLIGDSKDNHFIGLNGNDTLKGGAGGDTLEGGGGNDVLDGGEGVDVMTGGIGDDIYYVDDATDVINELSGNGTLDRVSARISYALGADDDIELLTTTNSEGLGSINLKGNTLAQTIVGNDGKNTLNDGGVGGADTLAGRDGNDTYQIYNSNAVVVELANDGTDRVQAGVDYKLGSNVYVESLTTTSLRGTLGIDLTGNRFAQTIIGNDGDNILNDGGKGAADVLKGGLGNDIYYIYNSGDTIVDATGGGADKVAVATSFVLTAGAEIEVLNTTSSTSTLAIDLTGNEFGQEVRGNRGANHIDGAGGSDTLIGGSGADTFAFSTALGAGNVDTIADFNVPADSIELDNAVFTALAAGALGAAAFVANTTGVAGTGAQRIIYDSDSGALYYDADGSGSGSVAIHFATVAVGLSLTNADFSIV